MTVDGLTPWVLPKAQKSGKTVIPFISSHWHNKLHRHYTEGYAIRAINTFLWMMTSRYAEIFTHKFRINNKISMATLSKRYRNGVSWNVLRNELSAIFCLQDKRKIIFAIESKTKFIRQVQCYFLKIFENFCKKNKL